ncbi:MAG: S8 family serine peptidase, partial [Pirellulales bacterium]
MAAKKANRAKSRTRSLECLEDRRVMSADPLTQLLGGAVQQQGVDEPPALVQHDVAAPDFWIDPVAERGLDSLAGDIDQMLVNADGLTGLSQVRNNYGFIGTGQTVAIIDSGIAWDHVALGGGLGSNYRVVGGWDFTEENDANPYDDGPSGSHGSHVSGIVGGDRTGTADDGVAPGVDFVGLRVFNDAGQGYFSWVESALRWVHQNRNAYENPITAINLSLGTSWNATTIPSWTTMEDEFAQLKADGIFVSVSAGNSFTSYNTPGLSYPAASPYVVPVMSVDDTGSLSYFSQRQARAIAAPGRNVMSSVPDYVGNHNGVADDYASYSGTSMAAPYIAGASVLVREAMGFVGYTNVTQDTIYKHMLATATAFFDAATNQSYKRINLANAVDSLIPTDDFGSSVATAYNLGQLDGASQLTGLIGKVNDADYFRFTAGGSGTVTFTAGTSHNLAPVWSVVGGTGSVSGAHGEVFSIQAVAGQTYTIGLSSSNGIGYYGLTINAANTFTYTDWGTITQSQSSNVANSGTTWYRLRANQTGYFTAEALFSNAGGNIDISLHNSSRQLLVNGVATSAGERADLWVTAGTDYFLRVAGTNADIDFRLTNLVSHVGTTVTVGGTAGADAFWFDVGTTQRSLSVNGTTYGFVKVAATTFNFNGGGGNDSIALTGSAKKETATLQVGYTTLTGIGIAVTAAGIENVTVNSGGGSDIVRLYDSAGNDVLQAYSGYVAINGSGFNHYANGFKNAAAYASAGNDTAHLYDTAGNDKYRAYVDHVEMTGHGYSNTATGFDSTTGHASAGLDNAYLYDSAGNDVYSTYAGYAAMTGAGYNHVASGFGTTYGYASLGYDTANMHDSAGDDLYRSYSNRAIMSGVGYTNYAYAFEACYGYSSTGNDVARQYGTNGNDEYRADAFQAQMSGDGFRNTAIGFERIIAYASGGVDRAWVADSALANLSAGHAWDKYSLMREITKDAHGFDEIVPSVLATEAEGVDVQA